MPACGRAQQVTLRVCTELDSVQGTCHVVSNCTGIIAACGLPGHLARDTDQGAPHAHSKQSQDAQGQDQNHCGNHHGELCGDTALLTRPGPLLKKA